jgi:hypothetical protein
MNSDSPFHEIIGKADRRWFSSPQFDLIVWLAADQSFDGFELCYDKQDQEHSIAWSQAHGYRHMAVDSGEYRPGKYKAAPILVPDGHFDLTRILSAFNAIRYALPPDIAEFVARTLEQYPAVA